MNLSFQNNFVVFFKKVFLFNQNRVFIKAFVVSCCLLFCSLQPSFAVEELEFKKLPISKLNQRLKELTSRNKNIFEIPDSKDSLLDKLKSMEGFLPSIMKTPSKIHIIYYPNKMIAGYFPSFEYKEPRKFSNSLDYSLLLGDFEDIRVISHEFGHVILDTYLTQNSPFWRFYKVWIKSGKRPLKESLESLESERAVRVRIYKNLSKNLKGNPKNLRALEEYIEYLDLQIKTICEALKLQEQYHFRFDEKNSKASLEIFKSMISYFELFSDLFTALYTKNWSSISEVVLSEDYSLYRDQILTNKEGGPLKNATLSEYAFLRGFPEKQELDTHKIPNWVGDSYYTEFIDVRVVLRDLLEREKVSQKKLLLSLAQAIHNILETEDDLEKELLSLDQKNKMLIHLLYQKLKR